MFHFTMFKYSVVINSDCKVPGTVTNLPFLHSHTCDIPLSAYFTDVTVTRCATKVYS